MAATTNYGANFTLFDQNTPKEMADVAEHGGRLRVQYDTYETDGNEGAGSTAIDTGSWVHIAVSRIGPTQIKAWINGTEDTAQAETVGATATMTNLNTPVSIGHMIGRDAYDLTGHIEEVRVSKVARWDANFTPPTAPYPTD